MDFLYCLRFIVTDARPKHKGAPSAPPSTFCIFPVVLAAIQILYLSIIHINRIGPNFFPALRLLVVGACEELVA